MSHVSHVSHMSPIYAYSAGIERAPFPPQVGLTNEKRRRRRTQSLPVTGLKGPDYHCFFLSGDAGNVLSDLQSAPPHRQPLRLSGRSCLKLDTSQMTLRVPESSKGFPTLARFPDSTQRTLCLVPTVRASALRPGNISRQSRVDALFSQASNFRG